MILVFTRVYDSSRLSSSSMEYNNRSLLNLVELDRYHYEASNHDTIPVSIERDVIAGWEGNRGSVMRKIVSLRYLRGLWR